MTKRVKKVCIVTGTRAEYGQLKLLCQKIVLSPKLGLQLVVTGSHLSERHGETFREIEADGFRISAKIDLAISDDSAVGIGMATGRSISGMSETLARLEPDVVLILGDRYELLGPAIASLLQRIPLAHLHGGELTEGAVDESIRHSLTKMAQLHFVATEVYRRRVIQMGESPESVFNVGGLGVDAIRSLRLIKKKHLENELKCKFNRRNLLVTFHPVTLGGDSSLKYLNEMLIALATLRDTSIFFTMPNADSGHVLMFNAIERFVGERPESRFSYKSLGQLRYFSLVQVVDGVVGNSSSGIHEVPSFKKPTINIGDRQMGRIRCDSIIDCKSDAISIVRAIEQMYSIQFQRRLSDVSNPYGEGGATDKITHLLESLSIRGTRKKFFDIEFSLSDCQGAAHP